jgi:hypothetical protein
MGTANVGSAARTAGGVAGSFKTGFECGFVTKPEGVDLGDP